MWETKKVFAVALHHAQRIVLWKNYSIAWGRTSSFLTAATKAFYSSTRQNLEGWRATTHHDEPSVLQHSLHDTCLLHSQAVANVPASHLASFGLARSTAPGGCPVAVLCPVGSPAGNSPYGSFISEYKASRGQPDRGALNGDSGDTQVDSNSDAHRTNAAGTPICGAPRVHQHLVPATSPIRRMWHRGVLELLCSSCRYVVRRWHVPILGVDCNANPRHKQALTSPPPRSRGIPKHLTPYLVGKQAPRHPRWRQDHMLRARATHFYRARVRRNG